MFRCDLEAIDWDLTWTCLPTSGPCFPGQPLPIFSSKTGEYLPAAKLKTKIHIQSLNSNAEVSLLSHRRSI